MHTVVLAFMATLTASWWFKRNVAKSPVPTSSAHLHAVPGMDRPGAAPARKGANVQRIPLALIQEPSNDDRSPSLRLENGTAVGGKGPQPASDEIHSPICRRFLELKGEAIAIVERHRERQAQLNEQLARKLSAIQERLDRLQQDANRELEAIDPKLPLDLIHQARRDNHG